MKTRSVLDLLARVLLLYNFKLTRFGFQWFCRKRKRKKKPKRHDDWLYEKKLLKALLKARGGSKDLESLEADMFDADIGGDGGGGGGLNKITGTVKSACSPSSKAIKKGGFMSDDQDTLVKQAEDFLDRDPDTIKAVKKLSAEKIHNLKSQNLALLTKLQEEYTIGLLRFDIFSGYFGKFSINFKSISKMESKNLKTESIPNHSPGTA